MTGESRLAFYKAQIEPRLAALLPSSELTPQNLHAAMRYAVLGGGKRLRPALAMAAALAAGGEEVDAIDVGCSAEFVHCFSLIHDDLPAIDNDDLRRGRATVHREFNDAIAVLAGDALFALAFEVLSRIADSRQAVQCMASLSRSSGGDGLVGGEVMDVEGEGSVPNLALVETIHRRKTGALISSCCEMGGIVAGASDDVCQKLARFGQELGFAFQVVDDVLNETSSPDKLGKASGSDKERAKLTYPAILGVADSIVVARTALKAALNEIEDLPGETEPLREIAVSCVERDS